MTELALETRSGLPDALRVLLAEYPRLDWAADPGFNDLIKFWLDRHLMFRRIVADMKSDAERLLDAQLAPDHFAGRLSRYGGMFVNGLHEHHTIEDTYYFPKLATQDKRIEVGFDILDKDHHAIDGHLNTFVETANDVLQRRDDARKMHDATGIFRDKLVSLERLLDRHLNDEEELIVPVILKFGAPDMG
ncbi:MAG: hemerythrin domain-containing protein [Yoonia sp.]|jgi:iron-sulfur cluster repair protein YtfE (RIC family)|nr:hemerythrin domain-containing protein [Yoonia sp.]MDG1868101.1 hemerythrin domain-containing protein [Yoonia sp.]